MNAWQHLPNARLIDWVIESLRTDPKKWSAAWMPTHSGISGEAWDVAWDAAWDAVLDMDEGAAWYSTWSRIQDAAHGAIDPASAMDVSNDVILALMVYNDCDRYLNMSYDQLLTYAALSERPQAILLLPLKWIQEHEQVVTTR